MTEKFTKVSLAVGQAKSHTSTPHRFETNGIAGRIKEGTSAVLLQSGLDEKCSMECYCYLRNVQGPLIGRENTL